MDAPLLTPDFKDFSRLLNANRVDYLLVGGYAVGFHGYPRATVDLDLSRLFVDPRSIVRLGVPPFRIEIMTSIDGVGYQPCRARAVDFTVDDVTVPVISFADLKINKRAPGDTRISPISRIFPSPDDAAGRARTGNLASDRGQRVLRARTCRTCYPSV